jgi:gliding motility-associated-like protein
MIKNYKKAFFLLTLTGGISFANAQLNTPNSAKQPVTFNWLESQSTAPPKAGDQPSNNASLYKQPYSWGDLYDLGTVQKTVTSWAPSDSDFCYLNYIENKGQWYNKVIYQSDFRGGRLFLEKNALTYLFYPPNGFERFHPHPGPKDTADAVSCTMTFQAIRMQFLNSNNPTIEPAEQRGFFNNYYLGNDPKKWASGAHAYGKIYYHDLYPGISAKVFSNKNDVRYDFIIAANTNPSEIKLKFEGQNGLSLRDGKLVIKTELGDIEEAAPIAYQMLNGQKAYVDCKYVLNEDQVSFRMMGGYDISQQLIIDPTLVFATYTGSTADNWGMSATYDNAGDGYTSGICFNTGYPVTAGAFQMTFQGGGLGGGNNWPWPDNTGFDIVVSKFNPTGTTLKFSTYLGGSDNEEPSSLIVDNANNLVVLGRTYSTNFPTTAGAFSHNLSGGADLIISKFDSNGTQLLASTYIGGSGDDGVNVSSLEAVLGALKYNYADDDRGDVIVDANNNVYVASCTISNNFPTTAGAYRTTPYGNQDGVVFKMNSTLSTLVWSTYIGGSDTDAAYNIALNSVGEVYVTGGTSSNNFPTTAGVIKPNYGGNIDGFLCHFSANGSTLINSTYIGTADYDQSYFVQTDKYDNVYIYGQTSGSYPITGGTYSNPHSGQFIHELNSTLSATIFSTEFGSGRGTPDIAPSAFLVDNCRNIYVAGWGGILYGYNQMTSSTIGLPTTANAYQSTTSGNQFYFMVLQSQATALWYATFFGGPFSMEHVDGGTSRFDKNGIIYQSICQGCGAITDMPTTPGAWSATNNSPNCNNAIVKFQMDLLHTVANFIVNPLVSAGCAPFSVTLSNITTYGNTFKWYFGDGDSSHLTSPTHIYTIPGTYRVMLVATDSSTCNIRDTAYATVRVVPPVVMNPIPDTSICFGDSVNLNAVSALATSFTWTPTAGLSSAIINNPNASPAVTTKYIVIAKDSFCSASDTVIVTINKNNAKIVPANPQICLGTPITLASDSVDPSYSWSTGQTTDSIQVSAGGEFYLHTIDRHGCKAFDSVDVIAFNKVPLVMVDTALCDGHSIQMIVDSGNYVYQWKPASSLNSGTIFNPIATPTITTVYTVTVTNGPCVSKDSAKVTVKPSPSLIAQPDSIMIIYGQTVNLTVTSSDPGWHWFPLYGLSCDDCPYPDVTPDSNTKYFVTITNRYGCSALDSVIIDIAPTFYVPSAFTPNGDGKNEIFRPQFMGYVSLKVYIFDRWGNMLYYWNTLDGGWDGTYHGSRVQEDVYVYLIEATDYLGKPFKRVGNVTVIR